MEKINNRYNKTFHEFSNLILNSDLIGGENADLSFAILFLDDTNNDNIHLIKDLFEDLLYTKNIYIVEQFMFIRYLSAFDIEFRQLINTINYDFETNYKIFVGGKLSLKLFKQYTVYFTLIFELLSSTKDFFVDNSSLVNNSLVLNQNLFKDISLPILELFYQDNSLIDVATSMFKNDLNVSKAAKDIFMHRNTVINKLELIKKITGFNIQNFMDANALFLLINK